MTGRVLIVDDEANMRWILKEALATVGYEVEVAASGQEAMAEMGRRPADLVVLDLKLKGMDGLATLRRLMERWPDVVVIILTAYGTVATAVEAMQLGAADYLRKPFDVEEIIFKLQRALERRALQTEVQRLRAATAPASLEPPAGAHVAWQRAVEQVRSLTGLDLDIVLLGEAGSGRSTLARFAHAASERRHAPLIELDLQAFAPDMRPQVLIGAGTSEGAWSRSGAGILLLRNADHLGSDALVALTGLLEQRGNRGPRLLLTADRLPSDEMPAFLTAQVHVPPLRERLMDLPLLIRALVPSAALTASALQAMELYSCTWRRDLGRAGRPAICPLRAKTDQEGASLAPDLPPARGALPRHPVMSNRLTPTRPVPACAAWSS